MGWIPPGTSRIRIAVLIIAPAVVFVVLAIAGLMAIGMVALLSAMGHGSLTREESIPYFVVFGILALGGAALTTRVLERMLIVAKTDRTPEQYALVKRTRMLSAALAALMAIAGPPLLMEWGFQREAATARSRGDDERSSAIHELGLRRSDRAYRVLRSIASDQKDDPFARASAAFALADYPEAKFSLITLTHDENPQVRAAAGSSLLVLADDDAAWSNIERLVRDDEVVTVREQMAASLASGRVHPSAAARRLALLKETSAGETPGTVLNAARGLGSEGYDAAVGVLMGTGNLDGARQEAIRVLGTLKDKRALPMLRRIVMGEAEVGFMSPGQEARYREVSAEAIGNIVGYAGEQEEWMQAYYNERAVLYQIKDVLKAQAAYAEATGFFDSRLDCLELPSTCVAGRDRDETLLGAALASLLPLRGYSRRLDAGAAPPAQIAARGASKSSATSFAYVAFPEVPFESGIRAFCADDAGTICYTRNGRPPATQGGRCSVSTPDTPGDAPTFRDSANDTRECRVDR